MSHLHNSLPVLLSLIGPYLPARTEAPEAAEVKAAIVKSVALLEKSRAEYLDSRTCFSCHHQGIPTLALTLARSRGFAVDSDNLEKQLDVTHKHLQRNEAEYRKGQGQGGQVDTAGTALWTLELGGRSPNDTTAAVAEYLLLRNKDKGYWITTSTRPPSEASSFTGTYLALRGLKTFATTEQKERAKERIEAALQWLLKTPPKEKDTEDAVFRLWALKYAGADSSDLQTAAEHLQKLQGTNGGWSQTANLPGDPYATGTALVALHQVGGLAIADPVYQRGVRFLLATQQSDGSWYVKSRSKPFQAYFESGYPHAKDQFISINAGGWATAALVLGYEEESSRKAKK